MEKNQFINREEMFEYISTFKISGDEKTPEWVKEELKNMEVNHGSSIQ